jgi:hypothetical protein
MDSLSKQDKKVVDAFTDKKPAESTKFSTDGKTLDGLWTGGKELASWYKDKIVMEDKGGKSGQVVQNYIRKTAPKNWLADTTRKATARLPFNVKQYVQGKVSDIVPLGNGEYVARFKATPGFTVPADKLLVLVKRFGLTRISIDDMGVIDLYFEGLKDTGATPEILQ